MTDMEKSNKNIVPYLLLVVGLWAFALAALYKATINIYVD